MADRFVVWTSILSCRIGGGKGRSWKMENTLVKKSPYPTPQTVRSQRRRPPVPSTLATAPSCSSHPIQQSGQGWPGWWATLVPRVLGTASGPGLPNAIAVTSSEERTSADNRRAAGCRIIKSTSSASASTVSVGRRVVDGSPAKRVEAVQCNGAGMRVVSVLRAELVMAKVSNRACSHE